MRHQVGLAFLDPFDPARIGPALSWRAVDHGSTSVDGSVRSGRASCRNWRRFGFNAVGSGSTCLLCSVSVEGCNGQTSPVTITIRHDPEKGTVLAARVPGQATCFCKLFGNNLNLVLSHIRFFQS